METLILSIVGLGFAILAMSPALLAASALSCKMNTLMVIANVALVFVLTYELYEAPEAIGTKLLIAAWIAMLGFGTYLGHRGSKESNTAVNQRDSGRRQ